MGQALAVLQDAGATPRCAPASRPRAGSAGRAPNMAVLNRNPLSKNREIRACVDRFPLRAEARPQSYLRDWAVGTDIKTMADVIAFNQANADKALRFGQDLFLGGRRNGRRSVRARVHARRARWISCPPRNAASTPARRQHQLDAVVFPAQRRGRSPGQAGYPQRDGAGRLHRRLRRQGDAGLSTSASPSPAAPGARRGCCASPTLYASRRLNVYVRPPPGRLPAL